MITISCDLIANLDTMRVTRLDNCGLPLTGANAFVSECLTSIAQNPVIDEQDDKIYRAANGTLCGVKRGCPSLLGYDLQINAMQVSPEMTRILTGNPEVLDYAGEVVGNDTCQIDCQGGFALEFWSELVGQVCTTTGAPRFLYVLFPWVSRSYLTDLEIGSEAVSFQFLGSTNAGGRWGIGPYNVVATDAANTPGPMLTPIGDTCHRRMMITTIAPPVPEADCGYTEVPAPVPPGP